MEDMYLDCLVHFNKYHDPKNGQFTTAAGGSASSNSTKISSASKNTNNENNSDSERNQRKESTSSNVNWKKAAIIGSVAVAGTLAAIGGYTLYKSGALDKYISKGKDAIKDLPVNKLGKSYAELDMKMIKSINGTGPTTRDRQINCTHTTTAYVLNSLFDRHVVAKPFDGYDPIYDTIGSGRDIGIFEDVFDGLKIHDYAGDPPNAAKLFLSKGSWKDRIDDIAPGSTGILWIASPLGASHVINYEKTKEGVVTLVDCQSKKVIKEGLATSLFKMNGLWKIARSFDFSEASIKDGAERILGTMIERDPDYKFKPSDFQDIVKKVS